MAAAALALALALAWTTASGELLLVDRLQQCYNRAYRHNLSTFPSFLRNRPANLHMTSVWSSDKKCGVPCTVFTTATVDRLKHLRVQCRSLPGIPVVAAIYLPLIQHRIHALTVHNAARVAAAQRHIESLLQHIESRPTSCCLNVMLMVEITADRALAALVPINSLRNAALLRIQTPLAAMIDVDLVASSTLAVVLSNATRVAQMVNETTTFWVLPAFEAMQWMADKLGRTTAQGKEEVAKLLKNEDIRMFAADIYPKGHNATDYARWLNATAPYRVMYERGYEPWGIASRTLLKYRPYDARFRGCFRDKVTQVASMFSVGASFKVIPDAWIIHQPHPLSAAAGIAFQQFYHNAGAKALQEVVAFKTTNVTRFVLHKVHSFIISDLAMWEMGRKRYAPHTGRQYRICRTP